MAWRRLAGRQFLALYPFILGVFNTLAFLALYSSLEPSLGAGAFFRDNFHRWTYIQEHYADLMTPGLPLAVALTSGLAVCLLTAAIRAPYFRAVVGNRYPRAPQSAGELARLSLFYLVTYTVLTALPYGLAPDSAAFALVSWVVFLVGALIMFADYVVVFENLTPWAAVGRSLRVMRRAWPLAVAILLLALLLWWLLDALYGRYYAGGSQIFLLLPLSQLLLEALVTTVIDVLLISTYEQYAG